MLCGVIAYAVGLEEALAHPVDPLPDSGRLAIALGLLLFVGGTALAIWRATCGTPVRRVLISGVAAIGLYMAQACHPLPRWASRWLGWPRSRSSTNDRLNDCAKLGRLRLSASKATEVEGATDRYVAALSSPRSSRTPIGI